jgi:hypothetical protein
VNNVLAARRCFNGQLLRQRGGSSLVLVPNLVRRSAEKS